ncbi:hypothetical protein D3C71_2155310 [compost metagenome]
MAAAFRAFDQYDVRLVGMNGFQQMEGASRAMVADWYVDRIALQIVNPLIKQCAEPLNAFLWLVCFGKFPMNIILQLA